MVVATGSTPVIPPIAGLDGIRSWTSRDATSARAVPRRLLVLGGGVVGVEMAQAWKRLGSEEVTIVGRRKRLLPREEPFAGELVRTALEGDGITVLTGAKMTQIWRRNGDGEVCARLEDGRPLEDDELLVAAGRRANTDDIGLDTVGLPSGEPSEVDDRLRVKGVAHQDRRVIVGATFVGPEVVAEMLHAATIAVVGTGPHRRPVARRAGLPHRQRDLAAAAGSPPRHLTASHGQPVLSARRGRMRRRRGGLHRLLVHVPRLRGDRRRGDVQWHQRMLSVACRTPTRSERRQ